MSFVLHPGLKDDEAEWPHHWPHHWPQWVKGYLDELVTIEKRFPRDILHGAPTWVDRMSLRIIQMMQPVDLKEDYSGPDLIGGMMGHLTWLIDSEDGLSAIIKRFEEAAVSYDEYIESKLSPDEYNKLQEQITKSGIVDEFERLSRSFIRLLIRKKRIIDQCLAHVHTCPPSEQAIFFTAYSEAIQKPPMDEQGALIREVFPGTEKIYLLLVLHWKYVQSLKSGAQCYRWLCSILGQPQIGTVHRIEKICYNFRINFSHRNRKSRKKKRRNRK